MKPEDHVRAAVRELLAEGTSPDNLDHILKTFASAIGGLLGCLQASSDNNVTDEMTEAHIDGICAYIKHCAKQVSTDFSPTPFGSMH